jgi:tRNA 2-thiouridine synthesizing protein A
VGGNADVKSERELNVALDIKLTVDATGLSCPLPIVRTAQAMKGVAAGDLVEVIATDPGSVKDFEAWSKSTGNALVESSAADGKFRFVIRHK